MRGVHKLKGRSAVVVRGALAGRASQKIPCELKRFQNVVLAPEPAGGREIRRGIKGNASPDLRPRKRIGRGLRDLPAGRTSQQHNLRGIDAQIRAPLFQKFPRRLHILKLGRPDPLRGQTVGQGHHGVTPVGQGRIEGRKFVGPAAIPTPVWRTSTQGAGSGLTLRKKFSRKEYPSPSLEMKVSGPTCFSLTPKIRLLQKNGRPAGGTGPKAACNCAGSLAPKGSACASVERKSPAATMATPDAARPSG